MGGLYLVDNAGCPIAGQIAQTRGGRAAGIRVVRGFGHQITKPHGQLRAVRKRQNRRHIRRIQPVGAVRFRRGDAPLGLHLAKGAYHPLHRALVQCIIGIIGQLPGAIVQNELQVAHRQGGHIVAGLVGQTLCRVQAAGGLA